MDDSHQDFSLAQQVLLPALSKFEAVVMELEAFVVNESAPSFINTCDLTELNAIPEADRAAWFTQYVSTQRKYLDYVKQVQLSRSWRGWKMEDEERAISAWQLEGLGRKLEKRKLMVESVLRCLRPPQTAPSSGTCVLF